MDNVLCDGVGRSGFRTEDAYQWNGRLMTGFDLMILMDEVQQIQLLTFVFMQTLGLDIKHSIGVDFHILSFQKPVGQIFFVSFFTAVSSFRTVSSSAKVNSFSSSDAFLRKPEPMYCSSLAVSRGSHSSSQRRNVIPLVLLLNFSGYSS